MPWVHGTEVRIPVDPLCRDWVSENPAACYAVAVSYRSPGSNPGRGVLVRVEEPNEVVRESRALSSSRKSQIFGELVGGPSDSVGEAGRQVTALSLKLRAARLRSSTLRLTVGGISLVWSRDRAGTTVSARTRVFKSPSRRPPEQSEEGSEDEHSESSGVLSSEARQGSSE